MVTAGRAKRVRERKVQMRPGFSDRGERPAAGRPAPAPADAARKKPLPPDKTHAEEYYFIKQMNAKTPMCVVLDSGEMLHGWVEWYDQECVKLNRHEGPNLLVYKKHIRYLYKDPEAPPQE
jgi:host factor-I protein